MKSLRNLGLCIGSIICLSLLGCASGADSDQGTVKTNVNTEQETKASIANNSHIPPQAKAAVVQNMDRAKAAGLGGQNVTPK
jgi:protein involved in sex pheromone biosynthesis